jgi:hypothetical protein
MRELWSRHRDGAKSALGAVAVMRARMDAWRGADEKAFVHAQRAALIHYRELGRFGARRTWASDDAMTQML